MKEIERKYLVKSTEYRKLSKAKHIICQGYLSARKDAVIRIRIRDKHAYITVKGKNNGMVRNEWEYEIPILDAMEMLKLSQGSIIEKVRYIVSYEGYIWEIDEFKGSNDGLVVAEIELSDEKETFPIPPFIGEEVTGNAIYYNSNLANINSLK